MQVENKGNEIKPITVKLPRLLRKRLEYIIELRGRMGENLSISEIVRAALPEYLSKHFPVETETIDQNIAFAEQTKADTIRSLMEIVIREDPEDLADLV